MAANSGGVDWNAIIKPFVTYSLGSLSKQEAVTLVKAVLDRLVFRRDFAFESILDLDNDLSW